LVSVSYTTFALSPGYNSGMNKTTDPTKLAKLHELDSLLPREIRGQSHALPRIISCVNQATEDRRAAEVKRLDQQIAEAQAQIDRDRKPRSHHFELKPAAP